MWQEQQEGKLKVSMTTWLWSGEMATSLWSMYSCLHCVTCLWVLSLFYSYEFHHMILSPSKATDVTFLTLLVTYSELHKLGKLCPVLWLVDNIHHHTWSKELIMNNIFCIVHLSCFWPVWAWCTWCCPRTQTQTPGCVLLWIPSCLPPPPQPWRTSPSTLGSLSPLSPTSPSCRSPSPLTLG